MNIYQSLYDLINTYLFGGEIVLNSVPDLVATLLSVCGVVFIFSIPFMLVWRVIKAIGG